MKTQSKHQTSLIPSNPAELEIKIVSSQGLAHLSQDEEVALATCESIVERHLCAFYEVGTALMEIRDKKLYRVQYSTFEEYCAKRWEISKAHAYRLLHGAEVIANLSPMGDILPQNERQARALSGLAPKTAAKAWKRATEKASDGRLTFKLIKQAVAEVTGKRSNSGDHFLKQSWQLNVKPLLQKTMSALEKGDKETVCDVLEKIMLLIHVGDTTNNVQFEDQIDK